MQSTSKKQKLDNMDTQNNNNESNNSDDNQENNEVFEQVTIVNNNPPIVLQEIKPFASSFEEFFEHPELFLLRAEQLNSPIEVSYFYY